MDNVGLEVRFHSSQVGGFACSLGSLELRYKQFPFRAAEIKVGDLVSPKIPAKFGSHGTMVQVLPEDHGIVTCILDDAEIECLFHNRHTWWSADELEVLQYA
jgi:hypothetical protein